MHSYRHTYMTNISSLTTLHLSKLEESNIFFANSNPSETSQNEKVSLFQMQREKWMPKGTNRTNTTQQQMNQKAPNNTNKIRKMKEKKNLFINCSFSIWIKIISHFGKCSSFTVVGKKRAKFHYFQFCISFVLWCFIVIALITMVWRRKKKTNWIFFFAKTFWHIFP